MLLCLHVSSSGWVGGIRGRGGFRNRIESFGDSPKSVSCSLRLLLHTTIQGRATGTGFGRDFGGECRGLKNYLCCFGGSLLSL